MIEATLLSFFLILFTIIGFILLIHWAIKESNIGDNQFGSDPLEKINEERIRKASEYYIPSPCVRY